jgi:hypothetical protein
MDNLVNDNIKKLKKYINNILKKKYPKMVYLTEEEIKHNEFMILRNSLCKSTKDINKIIEEEFSKKNISINKKKDQKVDNKKKPDKKYMY